MASATRATIMTAQERHIPSIRDTHASMGLHSGALEQAIFRCGCMSKDFRLRMAKEAEHSRA